MVDPPLPLPDGGDFFFTLPMAGWGV